MHSMRFLEHNGSSWQPTWQLGARYLVAILTFCCIVPPLIAVWPWGGWEMEADGPQVTRADSVTIMSVVPHGVADRAGIRVGDELLKLNNIAVAQYYRQSHFDLLRHPYDRLLPVTVRRETTALNLSVEYPKASQAVMAQRAVIAGIAFSCWLCGYVLSIAYRTSSRGSTFAGVFWMSVGAVLGLFNLAIAVSVPLFTVLLWIWSVLLMPLLIVLHLTFPQHFGTPNEQRRVLRVVFGSVALLIGSATMFAAIAAFDPLALLPIAYLMFAASSLLALSIVAILLVRSYRRARSQHIRHQIRLITGVVILVLGVRILLRSATAIDARLEPLDGLWVDALWTLIPLAYLAGGVSADLRRLDRLVWLLVGHVVTASLLAIVVASVISITGQQSGTAGLVAGVLIVALYLPLHRLLLQLSPSQRARRHRSYIFAATTDALSRTLDPDILWKTLLEGIQTALGTTSFAVFRGTPLCRESLRLYTSHHLHAIPQHLGNAAWRSLLCQVPRVANSAKLQTYRGVDDPEIRQVVDHPSVAAWCVICANRVPIGVVLLGLKDDLSPYNDDELDALEPVIAAASIAFANSAEYQARVAEEEKVRALYQRLQMIEDETKRAIVTEIHDEIINGHLVTNIRALERLHATTTDESLHQELTLILESERTVVDMLRRLGQWLYPPGIDDPVGLPGVLNDTVERHVSRWLQSVELEVTGTPVPLSSKVQFALLRIVREALTNAAKHANAANVWVTLSYPTATDPTIHVAIRDDGRGTASLEHRDGHFGMQSLEEFSRSIGGELVIYSELGSGTRVMVTIQNPPSLTEEPDELAAATLRTDTGGAISRSFRAGDMPSADSPAPLRSSPLGP